MILKQLIGSHFFRRYSSSTLWMVAEQGLRSLSALIVAIHLARYLGPEQFGLLSYALAVVAIFMSVTRLGMDSILVREVSMHPQEAAARVSTAFTVVFGAGVIGTLLLGATMYWFESDPQARQYVMIIGVGILLQSSYVVDWYFQGKVKARRSSIVKMATVLVGLAVKLLLIWFGAGLEAFVLAYAFDFVLVASLFMLAYRFEGAGRLPSFDKSLARSLLNSAWPMVLSAMSIMLYTRVDQIMIRQLAGIGELGLYSAAIRLYEGWVVVPTVISISLIPAMAAMKGMPRETYERGLRLIFALLFWSSAAVGLAAVIWADKLIAVVFGNAYARSSGVLAVAMCTAPFAALGSISARYLTVEGLERKIALRTLLALLINVALNMALIPRYGIEGAAYATLASAVFANYLINYFDPRLRLLLAIENRAILGVAWPRAGTY